MMFSLLFKDTFGLLPYLLSQVGINISWFSEALPAQALIVIHSLWGGVPFTVITLYSGLLAMPLDPLKAAEAEGASLWQKIRYVIVPYLSPLLVFNVMSAVMAVFRTYDSVAVMTKGGPGSSTETIQFYNMQVAFLQQNIGQGSAIAIISILWIFLLMAPLLYMMYREQLEK
jgi:multiple sugar transport system permease protein